MAWKTEEIEFVKNNYDKLSVKDISIKLNKSNKSVRAKIERLGIRLKDLNRVEIFQWTDEQINFLKQNYKTMIDEDIAKILFNDNSDKARQRVYRKRHSLKLYKDERGLIYNDNKAEYKSRFYHGERIFEHIENAEKKLGRKIQKGEIVHHINGDKKDNTLINLYICKDKKEHKTLHHSLEKLAMELFKKGIIKFDENHVCYFIDKNMLT